MDFLDCFFHLFGVLIYQKQVNAEGHIPLHNGGRQMDQDLAGRRPETVDVVSEIEGNGNCRSILIWNRINPLPRSFE